VRQRGFAGLIILVLIAFAIAGYFAYKYYVLNSAVIKPALTPYTTPFISPTPIATTPPVQIPSGTPNITLGWKIYTNDKYGFEIKYPSNFKALTDKDNLYGWPNAVVLFYGGGQSYDLPVEVWNTEAQYKAKYPQGTTVFKTADGKFITLTNVNKDPEVDKIIATFKFTQ
jgi:hypothetical protein